MENIYLHGIANMACADDEQESLEVLNQILAAKYLLSRTLQGVPNPHKEGFNGRDYISLCDYDIILNSQVEFSDYSSFELFIKKSLSIILNKQNIQPETTILVSPFTTPKEAELKHKRNPIYQNARFSDLRDEVQVKDKISLEYLEGITIPLEFIYQNSRNLTDAIGKTAYFLNNIDELLKKYNRKNKIYALEDFQELNNTKDIEKSLKKVVKATKKSHFWL